MSVQRTDGALAGGDLERATVHRMRDPRLQLTGQELIYAANALRAEARRSERQAADPQFESCRALFESTARAYDELAGKLDRIAEALNVRISGDSRS